MRGCMIEVYKILNCGYDVTATEGMFTINKRNSRRSSCKLMTIKSRSCLRSSFFTIATRTQALANLIMEGKITPALRLLEDRSEGGVLEPTSEVMKILNEKHPRAASVNWSGVLRGPLAKVHDMIFGSISSEDNRSSAQLTHSGAGPSGLHALSMRRILCSKEVRPASNDLFSALAMISRKLCKNHTDPSSVEAFLASRLLALDKGPGVHPPNRHWGSYAPHHWYDCLQEV